MAKTETSEKAEAKKPGNYYVTQRFGDKANFDKKYEVGEDVSDLGKERLAELVEKGVVEKYEKPATPVDPAK